MFKKIEFLNNSSNESVAENTEGQKKANEEIINKLLDMGEEDSVLEVVDALKKTEFSDDFLEKEENQEKVKQIFYRNILNGEGCVVSGIEHKFFDFSQAMRNELSEDNKFQEKAKEKLINYLSAGNVYGLSAIRTFIDNRYFFESSEVKEAAMEGLKKGLAGGVTIYDAFTIIKEFDINIESIKRNPDIINAAHEGLWKLRGNARRRIIDEDDEKILLFKDRLGIDMNDPKVKSILDKKDDEEKERLEKEYQERHKDNLGF